MISVFHFNLIQYINTGILSKKDYILSLIAPSKLFKRNASKIVRLHQESILPNKSIGKETKNIHIKPYSGNNRIVLELMARLESELKEHLYGAYLHGSLATQEEIRYSDFDALVILKDTVFEEVKRLFSIAIKLNQLRQIMHQFDPLQHHGWFVLTESMLKNHPVAYFPTELFKHSVSLLSSKGLEFDLFYDLNEIDFEAPFWKLSNDFLKKMNRNYRPQNSFAIKSLLSEFMLLPALYLQLKNKKAVYKKHSFEEARKDFTDREWEIMDRVSKIREEWNYQSSAIQKFLLCHKNNTVRKLFRKYAPPVSKDIEEKLTEEFYAAMSSFVLLMQSKIKIE